MRRYTLQKPARTPWRQTLVYRKNPPRGAHAGLHQRAPSLHSFLGAKLGALVATSLQILS